MFNEYYFARMRYVYILQSLKNGSFYIGSTSDLKRRIQEHNDGFSASTKRYAPWRCVYFEGYSGAEDAYVRERNLKYRGQAIRQLKARLSRSILDTRRDS